jgi:hypothetical protein
MVCRNFIADSHHRCHVKRSQSEICDASLEKTRDRCPDTSTSITLSYSFSVISFSFRFVLPVIQVENVNSTPNLSCLLSIKSSHRIFCRIRDKQQQSRFCSSSWICPIISLACSLFFVRVVFVKVLVNIFCG